MHRSIVSSLPCLIATFLHGYQDIDANGGTQRNEKLGEAAFDVKTFSQANQATRYVTAVNISCIF